MSEQKDKLLKSLNNWLKQPQDPPISEQKEELRKIVGYESIDMIPNFSLNSVIKHLPFNKFKTPAWTKPPCVILACGSFSPPTYLHLRIMEEAKDCLESEFEVIGGILSPVNDHYGKLYKKSLQAANGMHRLEMCQRATASSDWIGVSDYEVSLDEWSRVAVILEAYGKAIDQFYKNKQEVAVKFLCGSDVLKSFQIPNLWAMDHQEVILGKYGVVVCERKGCELNDEFFNGYAMYKKHRKNIYSFMPAVENTISSTVIRNQIKSKKSIKYLTPDPVIEYVEKEKLYQ